MVLYNLWWEIATISTSKYFFVAIMNKEECIMIVIFIILAFATLALLGVRQRWYDEKGYFRAKTSLVTIEMIVVFGFYGFLYYLCRQIF